MLTYKSLEIVGEGSKDQDDKKSNDITHKHIENMQKLFRTHRAALDFDKGFIVASLQSGKDFDLKQEVEIGPRKKKRGRKSRNRIHKMRLIVACLLTSQTKIQGGELPMVRAASALPQNPICAVTMQRCITAITGRFESHKYPHFRHKVYPLARGVYP